MKIIMGIVNTFEFQAFLKIILAALLTGIIGLERSSLNKPAGFGTHALLGVSAVLVVLCSEYLTLKYDIDMSRIPAQLLSGIGFIGAGTIMQRGVNVKGVTTAAGLLAVTCIGLTIGSGFYIGGIIATLVVYLILAYAHNISDKFERYAILDLAISIEKDVNLAIADIDGYLCGKKMELKGINRVETEDPNKKTIIEILICYDARTIKKNQIIEDLFCIDHIVEINEQ